ncbi:MAG: DUF3556 domain-containing protein [Fuerstiella sp.]|nr:DUF3556 domain-containing protein [Fuerstiella sp.]
MHWFTPKLPQYDPLKWREWDFSTRARAACRSWVTEGYGTPLFVYIFYACKMALYIAGWLLFCSITPTLGSVSDLASWWLHPLAFQKALLWSFLFEVMGFGCGSGPLTGRYLPPFGGMLYFLRTGTVKLALLPKLPVLGGTKRTVWDVLIYAALLAVLVRALTEPTLENNVLLPVVLILGLATLADKTLFLIARGEHYVVMTLVFVLANSSTEWIAGCQIVAASLWFFAGISKLNRHFGPVVSVMVSNSPVLPFAWFRRRMYRSYPDDLRPSRLAQVMAYLGTALELSVPCFLLLAPPGPWLDVGMGLMLLLHIYITINFPAGVPLEWNVMVAYGAFALFWGQPAVGVTDAGVLIGSVVLVTSLAVPLVGNFRPGKISFLLSMRYYAGNWPMSVWFFKGTSYRKLHQNLTMTSPWVADQLEAFHNETTTQAVLSRAMAFRLMHLHGRMVGRLLPQTLKGELRDYEWLDGECVAGLVLGWNFGDGHLHNERLLKIVQDACLFEPGQLRCLFVESQPLFSNQQQYRIWDACDGEITSGMVPVSELADAQPWDTSGLNSKIES